MPLFKGVPPKCIAKNVYTIPPHYFFRHNRVVISATKPLIPQTSVETVPENFETVPGKSEIRWHDSCIAKLNEIVPALRNNPIILPLPTLPTGVFPPLDSPIRPHLINLYAVCRAKIYSGRIVLSHSQTVPVCKNRANYFHPP